MDLNLLNSSVRFKCISEVLLRDVLPADDEEPGVGGCDDVSVGTITIVSHVAALHVSIHFRFRVTCISGVLRSRGCCVVVTITRIESLVLKQKIIH